MNTYTTNNGGSYLIQRALTLKPKRPRIFYWLLALAATAALFYSTSAKAIETDKVAHLGVSYMLTTGFYGLYTNMGTDRADLTPAEKRTARLFAFASSILVGFVYEMYGNGDPGDMLANGAGSALAIGSITLFDF